VKLKDFAGACALWAGKEVVFDLPSEVEQKGYSVAMHAILDNTRLMSIGFPPLYSFESAILRTLNIISNN
jgi:nucleoside-diphosphate-sugar epimerase